MKNYLVLDTETAGLRPPEKPASGVVQIAWAKLNPNTLEVVDSQQFMVNPLCQIHPEASKVHGWSNSDVANCPTLEEVAKFSEPTVVIGHNCLTGDHEVLTLGGWKRLDSFTEAQVIACWSTSGEIVFSKAKPVVQDFVGELLQYDTNFHKGVYTSNHRVYYTKTASLLNGGSPKWQVSEASKFSSLGSNSVAVPSAGLGVFGETLFTEDEARVLEMVRADGNIYRNSVRFSFSKSRKVERCISLLTSLALPHSVTDELRETGRVTRISLLECELRGRIIAFLGKGKDKSYGPNVLSLNLAARVAIAEEMQFWDGCKVAGTQVTSNRQTKVSTAKKSEADWIQALLVCSGYTSKLSSISQSCTGFSVEGSQLYYVSSRPRKYVKTLEKPVKVPYRGQVFCMETSTGAFLVRRLGAVWVTGNCSFDLKFTGHLFERLEGELCTLNLARHYIKDSKNHKLQTLAEHLNLEKGKAHDALGDVMTTVSLLKHIKKLSNLNLPELAARSATVKVFHRMPFGKHKDRPLHQVPTDYLRWFSQQDIDGDLKKTIEMHLKTR